MSIGLLRPIQVDLYETPLCSQQSGSPPTVHAAANVFQRLCYENKDALLAGIIVAGWDKDVGPSVYNIPVGGGLFRQPWAIGGSFLSYFYDIPSPQITA